MKTTGASLIAESLRLEGVHEVFALAGDHTLPLMDIMDRQGFRFIDTRHEQGAVDMANAWGRITGKPGVTMFTTPGHPNAIPGLTLASQMESPVVNIVGCAPQDRLGQGAMQEIDQVGMARPVTKGAWLISDPRRIPEYVARAFRTALSGRRGPVHLTIPLDVQEAEVDGDGLGGFGSGAHVPAGRVHGDAARVNEAVQLLNAADTPMIVAGDGAYSTDSGDLLRLVEVTRTPLFTEESARGLVPDSHPLCFGLADARINDAAVLLNEADVVLLLGKKIDFRISFGGPPTLRADAKIIQVEPSAELIGLSRDVDIAVQGDVGAVVAQLAQQADGLSWRDDPLLEELQAAQESQRAGLEAKATGGEPLHAMDVHLALKPLLTDDSVLVFEGSDFALYGTAYHPAERPLRRFSAGALGMIGWGVPFGIGATVARPQSQVVVLTGDGAFGFNAMELDTAVRHKLPVVVIVGADGVWGIDYHQQVGLYGRVVATELRPSRYDRLAEALGAHGEYVERAEELAPALERALAASGPAVVQVKTVPSPSPLTERILEAKGGDG